MFVCGCLRVLCVCVLTLLNMNRYLQEWAALYVLIADEQSAVQSADAVHQVRGAQQRVFGVQVRIWSVRTRVWPS